MSKIVMIDDRINEYYLRKKNRITTLLVENTEVKMVELRLTEIQDKTHDKSLTHATVSACILEELTTDYEIVNLQILKNPVEKGSIDDLVIALNHCQKLDAEIICMSLGTIRLSDSTKLIGIINQLTEQGKIIISAVSNQNYITLPASYDQVIGVRCCLNNEIPPGEIRLNPIDYLGGQIYGNCNIKLKNKEIPIQICNSYTVPVVAAYVNDYLNSEKETNEKANEKANKESSKEANKEKNKKSKINKINYKKSQSKTEKVLEYLGEKYPLILPQSSIQLERNPKNPELIPKVAIVGFSAEWANNLLPQLSSLNEIEGVLLKEGKVTEKVREYTKFIEEYICTDVIFYQLSEKEYVESKAFFQEELVMIKLDSITRFFDGEKEIGVVKEEGKAEETREKLVELLRSNEKLNSSSK